MKLKAFLLFFFLLASTSISSYGVEPKESAVFDVLEKQHPDLYNLYSHYSALSDRLAQYAKNQGFKLPYENAAVVVHEIIHIHSSAGQGFYMGGKFYEPYLNASHWPKITNSMVLSNLQPFERSVITSTYMTATPNNNLGNIIDEINAYSETHVFICRNEPQSIEKQRVNLVGFLRVVEAYLRLLRLSDPAAYEWFAGDAEGAGAVETFVLKAWEALAACGASPNRFRFPEAVQFIRYHQAKATGGK